MAEKREKYLLYLSYNRTIESIFIVIFQDFDKYDVEMNFASNRQENC